MANNNLTLALKIKADLNEALAKFKTLEKDCKPALLQAKG